MKRIFGTIHQFFASGAVNGRKMANAGFLHALLELDPFDQYDFYAVNRRELQAALEERHLSAFRRGAVRILPRAQLSENLAREAYHVFHLSAFDPEYPSLCGLRNRFSPSIFPVTAVNHTISTPFLSEAFLTHNSSVMASRDAIVANSSAAARLICEWRETARQAAGLPLHGFPQVHVLPMGVEPEALPSPDPARRAAMRTRLGLAPDTVLLLLFGRLSLEDKMDPQPLLAAIARVTLLYEDAPSFQLVLAGACTEDASYWEYFRMMAATMGVSVHLLPNPGEEERLGLYAAADIFVSPSDNIQETFGLALLEAGGAGLPSVVSDWDGYRDIVVHEETGILVPVLAPAATPVLDWLAPLLSIREGQLLRAQQTAMDVPAFAKSLYVLGKYPELRRTLGEAARKRVQEQFTCEAVVRRWIELWERLSNTPLTREEEAVLRKSRSLVQLPYGRLFAHFATGHPDAGLTVQRSLFGSMLSQGLLPLASFGLFEELGLEEPVLRKLLDCCAEPVTLRELETCRIVSSEVEGRGVWTLEAYVLWALKHDLLEQVH